MTIRKTKILDIKSITGVSTVGIFTAGVTPTDAGTAGVSYIKGLIAHNTGEGTATFSVYINKDTNPVTSANQNNRILRVDLTQNETYFFEVPYPITLTSTDSISVDVRPPSSGGIGIGSVVNVLLLGDVDI